jgi:DNA polymerase-3 subunit epsilon
MSDLQKLRSVLSEDFVILDTEATDKYPNTARIVQIAVIDSNGNTLLDTLVNPLVSINNSWIHGITDAMVADAPTFAQISQQLYTLLFGKQLIVYNTGYDVTMLRAEHKRCEGVGFEAPSITYHKAVCAMLAWAEYAGEWNSYHGNYKYQKLESAARTIQYTLPEGMSAHSALPDCLTTLAVCRYLQGVEVK